MKFQLDQALWLGGKEMRVAGLLQFDAAGAPLTRYLLAPAAGAPQIVEESGDGKFALLRPFPQGTAPEASGNTVTVMGAKYTLGDVRKLKVLGHQGEAPGGAPKGPLVLSGVFNGQSGLLLREIAPVAALQQYYSLKPLAAEDLLSSEEQAARLEAERLFAEEQARAAAEDDGGGKGGMLKQALSWGISLLIIGALVYACSGPDDDGGSSGSARVGTSHGGHGGK
jgi:hypothetical protein